MKGAAAVLACWTLMAFTPLAAAAPHRSGSALSCAAFMAAFARALPGHNVLFERPLNITRGFSGDEVGLDVRVLSSGADAVGGTLKCRGDEFRRFEVRIDAPASDKVATGFRAYQEATLKAAFGWDPAKVQTVAAALNSDAAEYLRASIQRGDTYQAGKVEYHQGDALDLGMIWTDQDQTLVVTVQDDS